MLDTTPTAGDLRAELARRRIAIYRVAAAIGMHPVRLGAVLNERAPLSPDRAQRIAEAIARLAPLQRGAAK
jgi:plasmid maintenance system antidote protein VapI